MSKVNNTKFFHIKLLAAIALLPSCATNGVADFRSIGMNESVVTEPKVSNGYQGVLVEMGGATLADLNNRANEICSTRGGTKSLPFYSHSVPIGWKLYRYSCNGFSNLTPTSKVIAGPTTNLNSAPDAQQTEREKNDTKQEQNNSAPQNTSAPSTKITTQPLSTPIALDDAKKKCMDLGFKPSTERFGQCVLRLSK